MKTTRCLFWSIPALCALAGIVIAISLWRTSRASGMAGFTVATGAFTTGSSSQTPEILWGAQFGSDKYDGAGWIVADAEDNLYLAGITKGNLAGTNAGEQDVFLRKVDRYGNRLWAKQWGTPQEEACTGLAIDSEGNVYVFGFTWGDLFATNPDPTKACSDIFVVKVNPQGHVVWSRQMGSEELEQVWAGGVDGQGNVILVGETYGSWFATKDDIDYEPFLLKLRSDGEVLWGKQFSQRRFASRQIYLDGQGNIYLAGQSTHRDISLFGGAEDDSGNGFLAKFSPDGNLLWGRVMGTPKYDRATTLGVGGNTIYVMGAADIGETASEGADVFLARYDINGYQLWYRVIVSRQGKPAPAEILVDASGNAILLGNSGGSFKRGDTPGAGEGDAWIVQLNAAGHVVRTWTWGSAGWDTIGAAVWSRREPGVFYVPAQAGFACLAAASAVNTPYPGKVGSDGTSPSTQLFGRNTNRTAAFHWRRREHSI